MKTAILKLICAALTAAFMLTLCSCGAANLDKESTYASDGNYPEAGDNVKPDGGSYSDMPDSGIPDTSRKIIQYLSLNIETLEYDKALTSLKSRCETSGGYVESANENGYRYGKNGTRSSHLVFRIPAERLGEFTAAAEEAGNVLSRNVSTNDVTESYIDTEARLKSLEAQRDRYMELLEQADNISDILMLTDALTQVQYQIESYTSTLRNYDSLISYCTVTIDLYEVVALTEEEPESFGDKISTAFKEGIESFTDMWESIAINLTSALPFLIIPAAVFITLIIILCRRTRRQREKMMANAVTAQKKESEPSIK